MKRLFFGAITIVISMLALGWPTTGTCVAVPNTPVDVEGTDSEYRELLGMWKGSWGNTDNILLIHRIFSGKIYFTHAWGDQGMSADREAQTRALK